MAASSKLVRANSASFTDTASGSITRTEWNALPAGSLRDLLTKSGASATTPIGTGYASITAFVEAWADAGGNASVLADAADATSGFWTLDGQGFPVFNYTLPVGAAAIAVRVSVAHSLTA